MKPHHQIVLFFVITQLLAIFSGAMWISAASKSKELQELSVAPLPKDDPANSLIYLIYILFGAAFIIVLSRFYKGMMLFKLIEFAVIGSSSAVVFLALALWAGIGLFPAIILSALAGSVFAFLKFMVSELKNIAAIISSAGVGALFGFSLGFLPTILFAILLSIYDYIAVFKTKHMIEMARELSSRQLSFAVTAKRIPERKPKESAEKYVQRAMEEGERLDLGTGDLAVPAMLAVSAFGLGANGLIYALAAAAGSTASIYLLLEFVSKQRVFLPALPPICLGGALALLAVMLAGF